MLPMLPNAAMIQSNPCRLFENQRASTVYSVPSIPSLSRKQSHIACHHGLVVCCSDYLQLQPVQPAFTASPPDLSSLTLTCFCHLSSFQVLSMGLSRHAVPFQYCSSLLKLGLDNHKNAVSLLLATPWLSRSRV